MATEKNGFYVTASSLDKDVSYTDVDDSVVRKDKSQTVYELVCLHVQFLYCLAEY